MSKNYIDKQKQFLLLIILLVSGIAVNAQSVTRVQPVWWFGESGAINFNSYRGTTQQINNALTVPSAFHKGDGVKPYASILAEYRPNKTWGGMLNIAYDNRGGKFDAVMAPCNCPASLTTNLSYITIEPSIRLSPFKSAFYVFAGPTIGINISKSFNYTQLNQTDKNEDWSAIHKTVVSAQAGAGFDIPLSAKTSRTQMTLSPFASFQTDLFEQPRSIESWALFTVRTGIALKFGTARKTIPIATAPLPMAVNAPALIVIQVKDVQFTVRAPKVVPNRRQVKETFPLINSVFFTVGSAEIPSRYILLNKNQATDFRENQIQQEQPSDLNQGRSARQLAVYHNILNILGDRLRANPTSAILLSGSSINNIAEGKAMAENIKQYLVNVYGIDASRITTEGSSKPSIPSLQPGATEQLALLNEEDHRVDISSSSPELLMQVGGATSPFLKPVQISAVQDNPLDSYVLFNVEGAEKSLKSWSVNVTDEKGIVQQYGPYTEDQASVSGKAILGNNTQGNYEINMVGITNNGDTITKESSVSLIKADNPKQEGLRYSILFNFDKSKTILSYKNFLTAVVAPLIPDNGTVIIHGHTDNIGDANYNLKLSQQRADAVKNILQSALSTKNNIKYEVNGFGADANAAPFENILPEDRFYNRTVIIDILPN